MVFSSSPSTRCLAGIIRRKVGRRRCSSSTTTSSQQRRVVVTGMGIVSSLGNTLEDVTTSLYEERSGITFSQEYHDFGLKSQVQAVPPELDMQALVPREFSRFSALHTQYAYIAMERAIQDAGLPEELYRNNPRVAAIIGQGSTSIPDVLETVDAVQQGAGSKRWRSRVGPFRVPRIMGSSCSAVLATAFQIQGPSYSLSSACATGAHCIGTGMEQILLNKADMAFCGAGESVHWAYTSMFDCMGALSTSFNQNPTMASRPYDKSRDGFVMGTGGGIIILEELEHAQRRGAKIYAEVVGYGANSDGFDMVAPSGVGAEKCMTMALEDAASRGLGSDTPVDYINAHATSTPVGDVIELRAIKSVFEPKGFQPQIGSTKSLSGHSLSAAGIHEAIYTILMMENEFLARSTNIDDLVDEAEGMNILLQRWDGPILRAMSNSFGFGGTNCVLVFDKFAA